MEKLKKSKKKNLKEIILENFYLYNEKIIEKKYENIFLIFPHILYKYYCIISKFKKDNQKYIS